jgi:hypothetical protein
LMPSALSFLSSLSNAVNSIRASLPVELKASGFNSQL